MKKISLLISYLFIINFLSAQTIPIGAWQEHLSYKDALSVSTGNGYVYCATASGVFYYRQADNSMSRLSKVNILSDVEATTIRFNPYNGKVVIAYKNSNIDLFENNSTIINISDIKRKSIIGNKLINNISFINQYAYLSCGFGIVVIDMDRDEVKDTYYIGPGGSTINVREITNDGTYIYAATDMGVYRALQNSLFLADYTNWTLMPGLPAGSYNTIASFGGKIFTNFSKTAVYGQDSMFVFNGTSWSHYIPDGWVGLSGYVVGSIKSSNNLLLINLKYALFAYNLSLLSIGYYSDSHITSSNDAVIDSGNNLWIADSKYGLVEYNASTAQYSSQYPNGPASGYVVNMCLSGDNLWVAPGGVNVSWGNLYFSDGLYSFSNDTWSNTRGNYPSVINLDTTYDIMNVIVDSLDPKRAYAASWSKGVIELYNGAPVKLYNVANGNSSLHYTTGGNAIWTYGLAFDKSRNLWISNSLVDKSISVKKVDGSWQDFNFGPLLGSGPYLGQILVDNLDQKWIVATRGGGIIVTNIGAGPQTIVPGTNAKLLSSAPGNGGLPSTGVKCLAKDQDGQIWVGTDQGICVFYSPENVFSGSNFDAQQILLEQDGHVQILLLTETVQAIAVDDANRKWIGTANSGVFLMSADGTKQIEHFDETNSPLFSNDVGSIVINHKTGEVYFGTAKGIISYRGTSTESSDDFTDVYAFPNPVKHDYTGPIAIKGLVNNTILKITDISGSLVYETKSEGGQAIWYGTNFKGERVSTGVYMVFCTSQDGTKKCVTKILVIN